MRELCWAELAIARQCGLVSIKHLAADALDLRHRLPLVWQAVQDLRVPAWVARKVAAMSRPVAKADVVIVDVAVAAAADQDQLPEDERREISRGELETKAVELLSNPHAAAALLDAASSR